MTTEIPQTFDEIVPMTPQFTDCTVAVLGWQQVQDGDVAPDRVEFDFSELTAAFQHRVTVDRAAFLIERMDLERDVVLDWSPNDADPAEDDQDLTRSPNWGHKRAITSPWWFKATAPGVYLTPLKQIHWFAWGHSISTATSAGAAMIGRMNDPFGLTFRLKAASYSNIQTNPQVRPVIEAWRVRGVVTYFWD